MCCSKLLDQLSELSEREQLQVVVLGVDALVAPQVEEEEVEEEIDLLLVLLVHIQYLFLQETLLALQLLRLLTLPLLDVVFKNLALCGSLHC